MSDLLNLYRKRQISQWEFPPKDAFVVHRHVKSGLSEAICEFVFYRKGDNALVTNDADDNLKQQLRTLGPLIP